MLKLRQDTPVSDEEFLALMRTSNKIFFDYENFNMEFTRLEAKKDGAELQLIRYMNMITGEEVAKCTSSYFKKFLISYENIPEDEFKLFNSYGQFQRYSFDKSIRERLYKSRYAPIFMHLCENYMKSNENLDIARTFIEGMRETKRLNNNGERLYEIPFRYKKSKTTRIYTRSQSIQGLPLEFCRFISAPKDYFILWADFKQVDWRVAWNLLFRVNKDGTIENNDDISDYYKAFAEKLTKEIGEEFDIDKFLSERDMYKAGSLASVYGGSESTINAQVNNLEFSRKLHNYINSEDNIGYAEYKGSLEDNIKNGIPFSCYTYFGTEMYLHPKLKGVLNAGLNRGIQGTSADLIKLVTIEIYKRVQQHLKNRMLFFPYLNRHDEVLFLCHKDSIKHLHEFINCCRIRVDDWDLLELEWGAGYNYKIEDEEIMKDIQKSVLGRTLEKQERTAPKKRYKPFTKAMVLYHCTEVFEQTHYDMIIDGTISKAIIVINNNRTDLELISKYIREVFGEELKCNSVDRIIIKSKKIDYLEYDNLEFIMDDNNFELYSHTNKMTLDYIAASHIKSVLKKEVPDYIKNNMRRDMLKGINKIWKILT